MSTEHCVANGDSVSQREIINTPLLHKILHTWFTAWHKNVDHIRQIIMLNANSSDSNSILGKSRQGWEVKGRDRVVTRNT